MLFTLIPCLFRIALTIDPSMGDFQWFQSECIKIPINVIGYRRHCQVAIKILFGNSLIQPQRCAKYFVDYDLTWSDDIASYCLFTRKV